MSTSPTGAIRISIPASVAGNLKTLQSSLVNIAERLGCKPCFSGADCFFQLERDWVINEKALASPRAAAALNETAISGTTAMSRELAPVGRTINVALSKKAGYNIKTIVDSVGKIAELSGHTACATGCNLFFQHFLDDMRSFAVNEKGLMQF